MTKVNIYEIAQVLYPHLSAASANTMFYRHKKIGLLTEAKIEKARIEFLKQRIERDKKALESVE